MEPKPQGDDTWVPGLNSVRNSNMAAVPLRGSSSALGINSTFTLVFKTGICLSPYEVNPTNRWTQTSPGSNWSRHNLTKLKWREMLTKLVHKGSSNKHLDKLKKAILWKPSLTLWRYDLARRGGNELYSDRLQENCSVFNYCSIWDWNYQKIRVY